MFRCENDHANAVVSVGQVKDFGGFVDNVLRKGVSTVQSVDVSKRMRPPKERSLLCTVENDCQNCSVESDDDVLESLCAIVRRRHYTLSGVPRAVMLLSHHY
jgi:predicted rRNA methylase YqxC with S4 and FtsJ domains